MSDDLVKQALEELQDLVRCQCHDAYKDRGLHDPTCCCHSAEAVKVVSDRIEELEAQVRAADALAGQAQRVKDFRYDPNIGIELNLLETALAAYRATKEGGA